MPTKLYLEDIETDIITPAPTGWIDDTQFVRRLAGIVKQSSPMTSKGASVPTGLRDICLLQFITPTLTPGQTITGGQAISIQMRCTQRVTATNMFLSWAVYVYNSITLKKTLIAKRNDGTEFNTTLQNRSDSTNSVAGNYTTVPGDQIVIEVGVNGTSGDASGTTSISFGSASDNDLPSDNSTTTADNPNLIFATDTLEFTGYPAITTNAVTDITFVSAELNAEVTDDGEGTVIERGFVFGTTSQSDPGDVAPGDTDYDDFFSESGVFAVESFDETIDGLDPDTTYYVRAFAKNDTGYGYKYGNEVSFSTLIPPPPPEVDTDAVSNIKATSALGNLEVTDDQSAPVTQYGFVFGTTSQSDPGDVSPSQAGYDRFVLREGSFAEGVFSIALIGLTQNETYYVRAFAKNFGGYDYGDEVEFTTTYLPPTIESVTPAGALIGEEVSIIITGQNFRSGATVEIDGVACTSIVVVNSETITAVCPVSEEQKLSTLIVENPDEQQVSADFYYMADVPYPDQGTAVDAEFIVESVGIIKT